MSRGCVSGFKRLLECGQGAFNAHTDSIDISLMVKDYYEDARGAECGKVCPPAFTFYGSGREGVVIHYFGEGVGRQSLSYYEGGEVGDIYETQVAIGRGLFAAAVYNEDVAGGGVLHKSFHKLSKLLGVPPAHRVWRVMLLLA